MKSDLPVKIGWMHDHIPHMHLQIQHPQKNGSELCILALHCHFSEFMSFFRLQLLIL